MQSGSTAERSRKNARTQARAVTSAAGHFDHTVIMRRVLLVMAVAILCPTSDAIVCTPEFCDSVICNERTLPENCVAGNAIHREKGGFCGCCGLCVTIIEENGACLNHHFFGHGAPPPASECTSGTTCINGICKKIANGAK